MKNRIIFLMFVFYHTIPATAQFNAFPNEINHFVVLDSSGFVIKYSLDFILNPLKPEEIDRDIIILEIGHHISKSYSYGLYKQDSIATACINCDHPILQTSVPAIEIFKNFPAGKNTVVHRSPSVGPVFLYEDEIKIQWEIKLERKRIAGYGCQRAVAVFRGRTWEAWFTSQIPISDGPWKFHGLPGLIMEVADDQNHYRFTCIGLSRKPVPIKHWKWKYERTSKEKANSFMIKYAAKPVEVMDQMGVIYYMPGLTKAESLKVSFPYNPLELDQ